MHTLLSRELVSRGYSTAWLCSGASHRRVLAGEEADADGTEGEIVAPEAEGIEERTRAIVKRISDLSPAIVMCHVLGDQIDLNAVRYLPANIPRVMVMHGSSLACYRAARALREHVNMTVAISPRIREDLIFGYGFRSQSIKLIPNGIDVAAYSAPPLPQHPGSHLRILSHGRVDKAAKGVFWLSEILAELNRHTSDWQLTVSGDGPDLPELRRRFAAAGLDGHVQYLGWTNAEEVPTLMSGHDVLLFPSRYEGFPLVLIEAMAGGCVPVASLLPGTSTAIVEHGINGYLFPVGKTKRAATHLLDLHRNRARLVAMRKQARERAQSFSAEQMADAYAELFTEIRAQQNNIRPAAPIETCALAAGLRPGWWFGLPEPVKNRLRAVREITRAHMHIS